MAFSSQVKNSTLTDVLQQEETSSSNMSYKAEITQRLKKKQRKWTLLVTIVAMFLTVSFIFVAFLISAKQSKLGVNRVSGPGICVDACHFQIVETIPSGMTFSAGSAVHPRIVDELKKIISTATKTINIASSYWTLKGSDVKGGPYPMAKDGQEIFDLLGNAADKRGVNIKIVHQVFCKGGHCTYPTNDTDELSKLKNVEVRTLDLEKLQGSGIIHTKMWLVDGKQIYLGSANMDWRSFTEVKELGLMTYECPCLASDMSKIFDAYWLVAVPDAVIPTKWPAIFETMFNKDSPLVIKHSNLTTNAFLGSSPPSFCPANRTTDIEAILHSIQTARKFINIAVMDYLTAMVYSTPKRYWGVIDNALRAAAYDRGVKVHLLASNWSHTNPRMIYMLKSLQAFSKACRNGSIEVKLFSIPLGTADIPFTRVNHNKYMVTESAAYIGTSNWAADYFINTAGIGYTISQFHGNRTTPKASIQEELRKVFNRDWNSKYAIRI